MPINGIAIKRALLYIALTEADITRFLRGAKIEWLSRQWL